MREAVRPGQPLAREGGRCHLIDDPACETHADQTAGTIVTLMCDSGARYTTTYDDDIWLKDKESWSF